MTQLKKLLENLAFNNLNFYSYKFLLLALISNNSFADWVYITSNDVGNDFYVSSESVKSSGWNKRIAAELMNYSETSKIPYKSAIVQQEYECTSNKVRMLSASAHSETFGKGKTLVRDLTPNMPWQTMPKVSVATQTRDYICNKSLSSK